MDKPIRGICHTCDFRHSCCPYELPQDGKKCKHWKLGKCYTCKHLNDTDENWFKRGCEAEYPGGCNNYKRDWRKLFKKETKK